MAKFVFDRSPDKPANTEENQLSRYDKTTSGKVAEEVATEQAICQQRYEQDHIAYLYASDDTTKIETHSELSQIHQAGTQSSIEYRSPEIHTSCQGDRIDRTVNQHKRTIQADTYTENITAQQHQIQSLSAYQLSCPTTESYRAEEAMAFNTSQLTLIGSDSQTQANTAGGVATTGLNQHGNMKVSTADYEVKSPATIDFLPASPAPKLHNALNRRIRQNQFDYDEVKWDQQGYFQVVDIVLDPQNQQWYLFDEPIAQCQLSQALGCLSVRQNIDQPIIAGNYADKMLEAIDTLSPLKAFDESSQMLELIHMGTAHVSYMHQSHVNELMSHYAVSVEAVSFDDDKQSVDFDSLVQTVAGQHPDEQFENLFSQSSSQAYRAFRQLVGLRSSQSLTDPEQYQTTPQARLMRYAMGISNQLGFNQTETALPLTQHQLIQTDYAKGEAVVEGHFPSQQGNVVMPESTPPMPQGCFVAELRFELSGFAGAAFLLSPKNHYKGCTEDQSSYPYLQTQSTHQALQSVDYGNKITGQLGWLMQTVQQIADQQPRDEFSIIAQAGGAATLSDTTPETFRIEYEDEQFYIAFNSAWLFETVKLTKQPKSKGTVMPFVVTYETFQAFIQFAYYQLLDRDYSEETDMIAPQTFKQLNELMAYGIWGYCNFGSLYKDHEQSIEAVKNKVTANELNRNDLADAINSETFADILPFATAYVKGRWLYTLLNGTDQPENVRPNRQQIAQAVKQIVGWIQTDKENKHVMQHYLPFSNNGKTSFAAGSKQFERDKAGL